MSADISLSGRLAFDSSVLVEIFNDSPVGRAVFTGLQEPEVYAFTSWVNLAEASYIVCRRIGNEKALAARDDMMASGFIDPVEDVRVNAVASGLKCGRAISLADCYTFAVANVTGSVPVFAKEEAELTREMKKRQFEPPPMFLS